MSTESRQPYQGLRPFREEDAPFFFGREVECEIISANLMAWRLTVLYGSSGVGKSSVLRAGVEHQFREMAGKAVSRRAKSKFAVVVFPAFEGDGHSGSWQDDPVLGVCESVANTGNAMAGSLGMPTVPGPPSISLDETLRAWTERLDTKFLIILDQFEEYFLYHGLDEGKTSFAAELARAVNNPGLNANFLISIREDSLARLDRFKGAIPNLFDNYLRVEHLDREAARAAIERPIEQHNALAGAGSTSMQIEPALLEQLLDELGPISGQMIMREPGLSAMEMPPTSQACRIQAPYLQLVMTRLWDEETLAGSRRLRLETLQQLHGASEIVRTHLNTAMNVMPRGQQDIAARLFYYLVTPSGSKIAQLVPDLAQYTKLSEPQITPVLERLAEPDVRILRPVAPPPDRPDIGRYEIYHDALASAILEYVKTKEQIRFRKRLHRKLMVGGAVGLLVTSAVTLLAYSFWQEIRPWGYFKNLATDRVYAMDQNVMSIGRTTEGYFHNHINLLPRAVSRLHTLVSRDATLLDMRSLVGTTVNGEFVPYGESVKLADGDLVVLGGIAPFQFERIGYSGLQLWVPPARHRPIHEGWGAVIDGGARSVHYLTGREHFLDMDSDGRLSLSPRENANSLLAIRSDERSWMSIEDLQDNADLWVVMKDGDYTYPECKIPPGRGIAELERDELLDCRFWRHRSDFVEKKAGPDYLHSVAFRYGSVPFQIVPFIEDLEPPPKDAIPPQK